MYYPITLDEICRMLEVLNAIPRPYGDNEGCAINSDSVFYSLYPQHQELVSNMLDILHRYTRAPGVGEVNNRAINNLTRRGYRSYLGIDQYDPYRLVGIVHTENWCIDISDARSHDENGDD
jgi:hypothetical protein